MAKISIISAGSWGTALALLLHNNGHQVTVHARKTGEEIRMLCENHEHLTKLPGVPLPADMEFTTDMERALKGRDLLVMAKASPLCPEQPSRRLAHLIPEGQLIVNVAKGIEGDTADDHGAILSLRRFRRPMWRCCQGRATRKRWGAALPPQPLWREQRTGKRRSMCRMFS